MKHVQLFILITTLLVGLSAQASKSAGEEVCMTDLGHGHRVEFYADDSQDTFLVLGAKGDMRLEALYKRHEKRPVDTVAGTEDLVIDIVRDSTVSKSKQAKGCYADQVVLTLRHARVDRLSKTAQNILGLKERQDLTLKCRTETLDYADECSAPRGRELSAVR